MIVRAHREESRKGEAFYVLQKSCYTPEVMILDRKPLTGSVKPDISNCPSNPPSPSPSSFSSITVLLYAIVRVYAVFLGSVRAYADGTILSMLIRLGGWGNYRQHLLNHITFTCSETVVV